MLLGQCHHRLELGREAVREDAERAVGEFYGAVAPNEGLEERRHFGGHAAKVDRPGKFEPVDPAGDIPSHAPGGTVASPGDLHGPSGGSKLRNGGVEPGAGDLDVVRDRFPLDLGPGCRGPEAGEHCQRLAFGRPVAADEHAPLGVSRPPRRIVGLDQHPAVFEPHPSGELNPRHRPASAAPRRAVGVGLVGRGDGPGVVENELRPGRPRLDPPASPGGEEDPRHVGQRRQPFDEAVGLGSGQLDRATALELMEPAGRLGVAGGFAQRESANPVSEDHQPSPEDGPRLADVAPFAPAHEHAPKRRLARARKWGGTVALGHLPECLPPQDRRVLRFENEGELPRPATVPRQRHDEIRIAARLWLDDEPAMLAEHRHMLDRRLGADGDPRHRPPFERFWSGGVGQQDGPHKTGEDGPLLGVDLIPVGIRRRPGADDHRTRAPGRMPGDVELHPAGDDHRRHRIRGGSEVEKKDERPGRPPRVSHRNGAGPHGGFDEPPAVLKIGRPSRQPHGGLPSRDDRIVVTFPRGVGGRVDGVGIGPIRLDDRGEILVVPLDVIGGDDEEGNRCVVVDAGEETATIDFKEDRGEHRTGKASPPAGGTDPGFERHSAAPARRELE